MSQSYAVLLPKMLPQEIHVFLEAYLHLIHEQHFLLCSSVSDEGYFLELSALKNDKSKKEWKLRLPMHNILAIADMDDKDGLPIGFLS